MIEQSYTEGRRYAVRVLAGSSRKCCIKWRPRGGPTGKFWITSLEPSIVEVQGSTSIDIDATNPGNSALIRFLLIGTDAQSKSGNSVSILIHDAPDLQNSSYTEALILDVQYVLEKNEIKKINHSRPPLKQVEQSTNQDNRNSKHLSHPIVPPLGLGGLVKTKSLENGDANLVDTARFETTPRDSARARLSARSAKSARSKSLERRSTVDRNLTNLPLSARINVATPEALGSGRSGSPGNSKVCEFLTDSIKRERESYTALEKKFADSQARVRELEAKLDAIGMDKKERMEVGAETFKVLYDFQAKHESELSITAGETVVRVSVDVTEEGWLLVQRADGKIGHVPMNYLQWLHVDSLEQMPPPPAVSPPIPPTNAAYADGTSSPAGDIDHPLSPRALETAALSPSNTELCLLLKSQSDLKSRLERITELLSVVSGKVTSTQSNQEVASRAALEFFRVNNARISELVETNKMKNIDNTRITKPHIAPNLPNRTSLVPKLVDRHTVSRLPPKLPDRALQPMEKEEEWWLPETWTRIEENRRIGSVVLKKDYEISFDLKILGIVNDFSSLLRFARGNVEDLENDDRSPAFFFPQNSTSLRVYTATKKRPKHLQRMKTDLPIGKKITIRLRVQGRECELSVDGERILYDQKMDEREAGQLAVCFAGDNHHTASNAEIRNIRYKSL